MICGECSGLVHQFVDKTLSPAEQARLVAHVQECDACRVRLQQAYNARGHNSCKEVVDLVSAYLEDGLSPDERTRFDHHLAICPPCRVYVEQMRETIQSLGSFSEETLTEEDALNLLIAFRAWTGTEQATPPPPGQ